MARGVWAGIWCVVCLPVGIWLALGLLERKPGEVPPGAINAYRGTNIASTRGRAILTPRSDWSKMEAYVDDY